MKGWTKLTLPGTAFGILIGSPFHSFTGSLSVAGAWPRLTKPISYDDCVSPGAVRRSPVHPVTANPTCYYPGCKPVWMIEREHKPGYKHVGE
jgi:hypothetical protein